LVLNSVCVKRRGFKSDEIYKIVLRKSIKIIIYIHSKEKKAGTFEKRLKLNLIERKEMPGQYHRLTISVIEKNSAEAINP
jgi:hypothetical protein